MRYPALAQQRRQPGEEAMRHRRCRAHLEHRAQLVVQGSRTLRQRDVLRDTRQVGTFVGRILKVLGEARGKIP